MRYLVLFTVLTGCTTMPYPAHYYGADGQQMIFMPSAFEVVDDEHWRYPHEVTVTEWLLAERYYEQ